MIISGLVVCPGFPGNRFFSDNIFFTLFFKISDIPRSGNGNVEEETTLINDPGREDTGSLAKTLEEWQVRPLLDAGRTADSLQPCLPVCGQEGEPPLPSAHGLF